MSDRKPMNHKPRSKMSSATLKNRRRAQTVKPSLSATERPGAATEKLQKVLARSGCGSRRGLETAISEGRIAIDGRTATLGDRVTGEEKIDFDGQRVKVRPLETGELPRVIIYNKPEGEVSTRKDPQGRPTVYDSLPKISGSRWVSVGRLDINTTGMLLLTDSGELANRLMHPSSQIDREYRVRIFGTIDEPMLQRLLKGVELDDGLARFSDVTLDRDTDGSNQWVTVTLMEGRNREVRRLWESQGVQVSRLKRVRFGPILLPAKIARGRWGECDENQVKALLEAAHLASESASAAATPTAG